MKPIIFKEFAGLKNTVPVERLDAVDLVTANNVDLDDSGCISRRGGQTLKVAGSAHSLWAEADVCLFVQGSSLKRLNPDFSSSVLAAVTPGSAARYEATNGRVYWTNGSETGVIDRGVNRSWGMSIPATPGMTPINGSLAAGTYQATMTYVRADGQESGAGLAARIDLPDNSGINFSWPVPNDLGIVGVIMYLTTPNGEILYMSVQANVAQLSIDYTGSPLSLPLNTQFLDAPPAGQDLAYHRGRLFIASGAFLFATTALGYEYCDLRDYLALDDSRINFVIGSTHGLYVGTERAVYYLQGERFDEMVINVVVDSNGVGGSAIIADGFAVTGNPQMTGQQLCLFTTGMGIFMGLEDGSAINLTHDRYQFDASGAGAAVFRDTDTLHQYLLFMQS